jgi:hypothetical protein
MQSQLISITKPEELKAAGLPWDTYGKVQWAFRKRHENGLAGAFVRIGRNVFVDPRKALELAGRNVA